MTISAARARQQYSRDAILSASPIRLLTMLYDRLLLDLRRAEAAQEAGEWLGARENLLHAQDIVAELTATLRPGAWDGAAGLRGIYDYVHTALIHANIHRDVARTREAAALLEPLRQSWHAAAASVPAEPSPTGGYGLG
ncbi:flagellar export chaperone FliS [Sinomonas sp. JGH33]|uniref:Flagellar export chaperone FliS n=1 Tax=Sinomonas terricola TaxID=3110330 RepID=A0ABU5TBR0_9MICC|nr:flagellar export chaperone FliS [Sinomonas sp. JGH33]MEA5457132.1 flagellar export chaperone FliS [Sinomonas sp. JGH33]